MTSVPKGDKSFSLDKRDDLIKKISPFVPNILCRLTYTYHTLILSKNGNIKITITNAGYELHYAGSKETYPFVDSSAVDRLVEDVRIVFNMENYDPLVEKLDVIIKKLDSLKKEIKKKKSKNTKKSLQYQSDSGFSTQGRVKKEMSMKELSSPRLEQDWKDGS
jgi:hypothetical protein